MSGNDGNKVDVEALRRLYGSSSSARAVFDYLAQRRKNSFETTVERLQANLTYRGSGIPRSEILEVLRALDRAGCGTFKVGRKGHSSRFIWNVSLMAVGKAAAGELRLVPEMTVEEKEEAEAAELDPESEDEETVPDLVEHRYVLRPDEVVTVLLPRDLTATEAGRLADWIRTLPFGEGETVADRIVLALRVADAPLCDDCLAFLCDLSTRQQANADARFLQQKGRIRRWSGTCSRCSDEKLINQLHEGGR